MSELVYTSPIERTEDEIREIIFGTSSSAKEKVSALWSVIFYIESDRFFVEMAEHTLKTGTAVSLEFVFSAIGGYIEARQTVHGIPKLMPLIDDWASRHPEFEEDKADIVRSFMHYRRMLAQSED